MKLYVLEERASAEQDLPAPQVRRNSRVVVLAGALALLLGVSGVILERVRSLGPDSLGTDIVKAERIASVDVAPPPTMSMAPTATLMAKQHGPQGSLVQSDGTEAVSAPAEPSSIVRKGDKIVVELHAVDIGSALTMMSQATRTRVMGADVLRGNPARLTATLTATSRQSAWQSVFGNVANFGLSCVGESCVVHIVSAVSSGEGQAQAPLSGGLAQDLSAPATNVQPEIPMAAAVAALQQQQQPQTVYSEDY